MSEPCRVVGIVPLTILVPDGSHVAVPEECAWLLTRHMPEPPMVSRDTGKRIEITDKNGRLRIRAVFETVRGSFEDMNHIVRVRAGEWRFWREGARLLCEYAGPVERLPLRRHDDTGEAA